MDIDFSSYTVIDVETPNKKNDCVCSIACMHVVDGEIKHKVQYLVNPECAFDSVNISINGITPSLVQGKPSLREIWNNISDFFTEKIIVAHNATFDLNVIRKALSKYGIIMPKVYYICTMSLAKHFLYKNCVAEKGGLSLAFLCNKYGIPIKNHHDSMCDVVACDEVLSKLFTEFEIDPSIYVQTYSETIAQDNNANNSIKNSNLIMGKKEIEEFQNLIKNVNCVCRPTLENILDLIYWAKDNPLFFKNSNFLKIYDFCTVLYSGRNFNDVAISPLITLLREFTAEMSGNNTNPSIPTTVCEICFPNTTFCLSGNFVSYSKDEIKDKLIQLGAECKDTVTKKTDYLIVGENGDASWKFGNFGTKVVKAIDMQSNGHPIKLVAEKDFIPFLKI